MNLPVEAGAEPRTRPRRKNGAGDNGRGIAQRGSSLAFRVLYVNLSWIAVSLSEPRLRN